MPSKRSRLVVTTFKIRRLISHVLKGNSPDLSPNGIEALRRKTEKTARMFGKLPKGMIIHPNPLEKIYAEWISLPESPDGKAILYFHGGGYVIGSPQSHRIHVSKIVSGTGIRAFLFDYRLAPEHPFPAALDDALKVYDHLLSIGLKPSDIVFMGDSAGGGLCLATLGTLKDAGKPLPSGAVALSPWTDLTCSAQSLKTNLKKDPMTWEGSCLVFSEYYCGGHDPVNPKISPLFDDLDGLPPLMIFAGEDEVMRDDAIRYAEKATQSGTEVSLTVGAGMFHCYPVMSPLFPEAKKAMGEICGFIRRRLDMKRET
ncbi:MAG: alpha/beta hydrolase [Bacteroidales bacterium]|nr:alpha/beta hydrolase [Bacteroidales bacterium]